MMPATAATVPHGGDPYLMLSPAGALHAFAQQQPEPQAAMLQSLMPPAAAWRRSAWLAQNPQRTNELLWSNPRYVFFREVPAKANDNEGPPGALGVPLSAERSIAVDPRHVPLGAPVFLSTTQPNSTRPLRRLMLAQDTGGAIRGVVRADFFWGFGAEAGSQAGRMKQQGQMWVLLLSLIHISEPTRPY